MLRNFCFIAALLMLSGCASQKVKIQLGNNGIAPTLSLTFDPVPVERTAHLQGDKCEDNHKEVR